MATNYVPYLEDRVVSISSTQRLFMDPEELDEFGDESADAFDTDFDMRGRVGGFDLNHHCHPQVKPPRDRSAEKTLLTVSVLTLVFIVGEFTGGILAHSLAIMTDAGHMLSDLLSFVISLIAIWIARRPATKRLSFGFYRAEVLGAVISILIIWVLTGILVFLAVERVVTMDFHIEANPMLITSGMAVLFNIIMGLVLHFGGGGHGHSHFGGGHGHAHGGGHGHSHSSEPPPVVRVEVPDASPPGSPSLERGAAFRVSNGSLSRRLSVSLTAYPSEDVTHINKTRNINVRAAFVHVIGDLVQSIGVLIAAVIIKIKPEYKIADPICTFIFSILVLITTLVVMRDAVLVLMEGTPRDVDYNQVRTDLQKIQGVRAAHSLHMWSLTMDKAAMAVHLAIDPSVNALLVMQNANRMMRYKYNLTFTTVQVEPYDESVMSKCEDCVGPEC